MHEGTTVRLCAWCGDEFTRDDRHRARYCSPVCYERAKWQRRVQAGGYGKSHHTVRPVACVRCETSLPKPGRTRGIRLYCESCKRGIWKPKPDRVVTCVTCGVEFSTRQPRAEACSTICKARSPKAKARAAVRRGAVNAATFSAAEIAERDGWMCGICGERIPKRARHPDGRSLSIDHIIPVSEGGDHVPSNVQAAHLRCNLSKGVRAVGCQLRLV